MVYAKFQFFIARIYGLNDIAKPKKNITNKLMMQGREGDRKMAHGWRY